MADADIVLAARRDAAEHLRRLIPLVAYGDLSDAQLATLSTTLQALSDQYAPFGRSGRYDGRGGVDPTAGDSMANELIWDSHCVFGRSNAMAPPLIVTVTNDTVEAEASYGPMFEGQSGFVHGGALAAAFDVVSGRAAGTAGKFIVTGTLSIRFERSVRTTAPVRFEAHISEISGRKITTVATAHSDGHLNATAHAVFITVGAERYTEANPATPEQPARG
jgi:acyl-coenzyme A thioesterase PaaI-like protein